MAEGSAPAAAAASPPEGDTLVDLLNRATNPSNREDDVAAIDAFVEKIKSEKEGPQMSVRLLAHKMQVRVYAYVCENVLGCTLISRSQINGPRTM